MKTLTRYFYALWLGLGTSLGQANGSNTPYFVYNEEPEYASFDKENLGEEFQNVQARIQMCYEGYLKAVEDQSLQTRQRWLERLSSIYESLFKHKTALNFGEKNYLKALNKANLYGLSLLESAHAPFEEELTRLYQLETQAKNMRALCMLLPSPWIHTLQMESFLVSEMLERAIAIDGFGPTGQFGSVVEALQNMSFYMSKRDDITENIPNKTEFYFKYYRGWGLK